MGLLPDTQNCGCACAGNAGNVFPVTAGKRSRHASRHVRHARAVIHAGIANLRFPLKSAAGENVPGIPGACATCNFTYLVRGPCRQIARVVSILWWRHQMETFSALLAICAGNSPGTGEFLTQRPVTQSFDVFFDLRLNKRLSKQWWGWWLETPSRPVWRHCNAQGINTSLHHGHKRHHYYE